MASLKIQVVWESGSRATLEVQLPLKVTLGEELNSILGADGVEHFFTLDGSYDGWSRPVAVPSHGMMLHPEPMRSGFFSKFRLRRVK